MSVGLPPRAPVERVATLGIVPSPLPGETGLRGLHPPGLREENLPRWTRFAHRLGRFVLPPHGRGQGAGFAVTSETDSFVLLLFHRAIS
jgi:hypothetical protein